MAQERDESTEALRELARRVMDKDAELLERHGGGPSNLDEVLAEELPRYEDAMRRLGQ